MTMENVREEHRAWSPTPQLPRLAPPVDRTGRAGGALGQGPGVEADSFWDDAWSVVKTVGPIVGAALL
ncbi:hypothetical protein ABZW03_39810 [Kitasatospora sp. NPDC004799]|uniref:hypothetical protein n=1 Tax=Kitasatospora sp. NPDC004799 TaxID=3154460 RepID=UPI0033A45C77